MTGRDMITAALRLIGAVAPGESIAAGEATDGLATLNRMIDSWSNDSLLIPARVREEFTLTANDGNYTMGTGANFSTPRPINIENAAMEVSGVETQIKIIRNAQEWAEIISKDATSTIPQYLFPEGTYPYETLNLYPIPSTAANVLVLYSRKPLTTIATLDTSVSLPPGYEEAMLYNLAIRLGPEYGKQPSDLIMMTASDSKTAIMRTNSKPTFLKVDAALSSGRSRNILTGES